MESYFIIVILVIFIILIFTLDFDNPITTTIYIQGPTSGTKTLIYEVPYNDNTDYTNLINATFTGTISGGPTTSVNTTTFNYNTFTTASPVAGVTITPVSVNDHTLQVVIENGSNLDGFLTLTLLCTGDQTINGGFKRLS